MDNPPPGGVPCIYATFEDEEARQHALKVLNGAQWKQNTLVAKVIKISELLHYKALRNSRNEGNAPSQQKHWIHVLISSKKLRRLSLK